MNAGQRCAGLLLTLALLVLPFLQVQASANSLQNLNYYVIYDPVEDSGLMVVNATVSTADCEFLAIPVTVIGEDAELELLNYTVEGELLLDGVDCNETGYVELFGCGNGTISLLLSVKNLFEEEGVLSYSTVIDTGQLEGLSAQVKVVVKVIGNYSVAYEQVGSVKVYVEESEGMVEIMGYGMVFLTLHAAFEEIVPTATPFTPLTSPSTATLPPHTTPSTEVARSQETRGFFESSSNLLVTVVLLAATVVVAVVVLVFIKKRKGSNI